MTYSINRVYIPGIDHIRAFAALLVVFYHGLQLLGTKLSLGVAFDPEKHWLHSAGVLITILEEGHSGVGLFIVLSGFVLSLGVIGKEIDYGKFLMARVLRIYPMMSICLVAAMSAQPKNTLLLLTYLSPFHSVGVVGSVFIAMFWAVSIEFQCYLIFPFLNRFANQKGVWYLGAIILIVILLSYLAVCSDFANPRDISYKTLLGRLSQFCIGMIGARLYLRCNWGSLSPWFFLPSALLTGSVLVLFNKLGGYPLVSDWKILWQPFEGGMWGIFIITYLSVARRLPGLLSRGLAAFGETTYSFYLLHFAVLYAIISKQWYIAWSADGYSNALLTVLLIVVPVTALIARLTYSTIELPFLQMRSRYTLPENGGNS